jgi:hypothetical protein
MGPELLRDADIKKELQDYFDGHLYPLNVIRHTIEK